MLFHSLLPLHLPPGQDFQRGTALGELTPWDINSISSALKQSKRKCRHYYEQKQSSDVPRKWLSQSLCQSIFGFFSVWAGGTQGQKLRSCCTTL